LPLMYGQITVRRATLRESSRGLRGPIEQINRQSFKTAKHKYSIMKLKLVESIVDG
jgi:hypothetical protein